LTDTTVQQIRPFLRDHVYAGRSLLFLEETESTNLFLLKNKKLLSMPGLVVQAGRQTKGIGRRSRSWCGGAAEHLFCSFVIMPPSSVTFLPSMTLLCGLAVFRCLRDLGVRDVVIKWPNDILIKGKKVSGILCHASFFHKTPVVVAGIGINVKGSASQFPGHLRKKAGTLEDFGIFTTPSTLLVDLSRQLEKILVTTEKSGLQDLIDEWKKNALCTGYSIAFNSVVEGATKGIIKDLDQMGRLIVRDLKGGIHIVDSGDIDHDYSQ